MYGAATSKCKTEWENINAIICLLFCGHCSDIINDIDFIQNVKYTPELSCLHQALQF